MDNYTILPVPYTVGPEAYNSVAEYTRLYGTKAVVIGGEKAMNASREKLLNAVEDTEITILDFVHFGKECTFEAAGRLETVEAVKEADMIFAVGGGKAGEH